MATLLWVAGLFLLLTCKIFLFVLYVWQFYYNYHISTWLVPHFIQVSATSSERLSSALL